MEWKYALCGLLIGLMLVSADAKAEARKIEFKCGESGSMWYAVSSGAYGNPMGNPAVMHKMVDEILLDRSSIVCGNDENGRYAEFKPTSMAYATKQNMIPMQSLKLGNTNVDAEYRGKVRYLGEDYFVREVVGTDHIYLAKGQVFERIRIAAFSEPYLGYSFRIARQIHDEKTKALNYALLDVKRPDGSIVQTMVSSMANGVVDDIEIALIPPKNILPIIGIIAYDTTTDLVLEDARDLADEKNYLKYWKAEFQQGQVSQFNDPASDAYIKQYKGATGTVLNSIKAYYRKTTVLRCGETIKYPGATGEVKFVCPTTTTTVPETCKDSDVTPEFPDGKNYYQKGAVSGPLLAPNYTREDMCMTTFVREMICKNGIGTPTLYKCPNGCQDGACVSKPKESTTTTTIAKTCLDSDWIFREASIYVPGHITGKLTQENLPREDTCLDGKKLRELFCTNEGLGEPMIVDCPNGCVNGACVWPGADIKLWNSVITPDETLKAEIKPINGQNLVFDAYIVGIGGKMKKVDSNHATIGTCYVEIDPKAHADVFAEEGTYNLLIADPASAGNNVVGLNANTKTFEFKKSRECVGGSTGISVEKDGKYRLRIAFTEQGKQYNGVYMDQGPFSKGDLFVAGASILEFVDAHEPADNPAVMDLTLKRVSNGETFITRLAPFVGHGITLKTYAFETASGNDATINIVPGDNDKDTDVFIETIGQNIYILYNAGEIYLVPSGLPTELDGATIGLTGKTFSPGSRGLMIGGLNGISIGIFDESSDANFDRRKNGDDRLVAITDSRGELTVVDLYDRTFDETKHTFYSEGVFVSGKQLPWSSPQDIYLKGENEADTVIVSPMTGTKTTINYGGAREVLDIKVCIPKN
jgi:hypothetical protein